MRYAVLMCAAMFAVLMLPLAGCGGKQEAKKDAAGKGGDVHDHPTEGPHKGAIVELGNEEYHAELCHDDAANKVTVYILDEKAAKAVPVAEKEVKINIVVDGKPAQFALPAVPQEGDGADQSSRFELVDEKLCESLDAKDVAARLVVNIAGKRYEGKIGEHKHAH